MAFSLTRFQAYGIEVDEPLTKRFVQRAHMIITALATDVDLDLGDDSGTFWTAVGGTDIGAVAQQAMKDIATRAWAWLSIQGTGISIKSQAGASTVVLSSDASAGGAASEILTVTGLAVTDTILSVDQRVEGANATAVTGWNTQAANALTVTWTANPGAGAIVDVAVQREAGSPDDGQYVVTVQDLRPNLLFASGDAPTAYNIVLEWELKDGAQRVSVLAA